MKHVAPAARTIAGVPGRQPTAHPSNARTVVHICLQTDQPNTHLPLPLRTARGQHESIPPVALCTHPAQQHKASARRGQHTDVDTSAAADAKARCLQQPAWPAPEP